MAEFIITLDKLYLVCCMQRRFFVLVSEMLSFQWHVLHHIACRGSYLSIYLVVVIVLSISVWVAQVEPGDIWNPVWDWNSA